MCQVSILFIILSIGLNDVCMGVLNHLSMRSTDDT